jgi:hypothetical protein
MTPIPLPPSTSSVMITQDTSAARQQAQHSAWAAPSASGGMGVDGSRRVRLPVHPNVRTPYSIYYVECTITTHLPSKSNRSIKPNTHVQ